MMFRSQSKLADGRQILYYDDVDRRRKPTQDPRALAAIASACAVRVDALTGEQVVVASHRQTRTFLPAASDCPLCPGGGEVPDGCFDVAVFENRWPSFQGSGTSSPGRCEVVVFSDQHNATFGGSTSQRASTIMQAWCDRDAALSQHPDVRFIGVFENRGPEIGVTLHHPHGQIYGYPFVPPNIAGILNRIVQHRASAGRDLMDDVLAAELRGPRVVCETATIVAFVPVAARWPYEVMVVPRQHAPRLSHLDASQRTDLAEMLPAIARGLDNLFGFELPYISTWLQSPVGRDDLRLHWRVFSPQRDATKLKYLAGSESGFGTFINDVEPEQAASRLRLALA